MLHLRVTALNEKTVHVSWDAPIPANGPLDKMVYHVMSKLGNDQYTDVTNNTAVDLMFDQKCGYGEEELTVWVKAVNKVDGHDVEGPDSDSQMASICNLTSIPIFYYNVSNSNVSLNTSSRETVGGTEPPNVGVGNDAESNRDKSNTGLRHSHGSRHERRRKRWQRYVSEKFVWMCKMSHICRWQESFRFFRLFHKYYLHDPTIKC